MAPRISPSKLRLINDMIQSQSLTRSQMAKAAECSEQTIKNIRRNLRLFGHVHAPPTRVGRRRSLTPPMLEALCDHLLEKPGDGYLSCPKAGRKRPPDRVLKSRVPNYEKFIFITSPSLHRTTFYMLMNLDVINELGSDGQAGHHLV
ncbi:hypothetical protein NUU61_004571 [Penicillium alfredii]|uniref:Uncharacterized protein n=1 Tax=Penicillium alfredii TaxID=1506179 RepID=A0A9W9FLH5_9EURO|nr:uncharacterized protein NUU61_004571 [Penicillium alfredii]KAJ5102349.1 hypothetical protein NUU61_004571 [Penicillium alfredii]